MKILIRYSFIFLAWLFMFGHSVVPHMHHDEQEDHFTHEMAHEESGLLDYLAQLFHFSSGERHLEDFRTNNGISAVFLVPQCFVLPAFIPFSEHITHYFPEVSIQEIPISTLALRGPPVVS